MCNIHRCWCCHVTPTPTSSFYVTAVLIGWFWKDRRPEGEHWQSCYHICHLCKSTFFKTQDVEIPGTGTFPHTCICCTPSAAGCHLHIIRWPPSPVPLSPLTVSKHIASSFITTCRTLRNLNAFSVANSRLLDLPERYLLWKSFSLSDLELFLCLPSVSWVPEDTQAWHSFQVFSDELCWVFGTQPLGAKARYKMLDLNWKI